jgi:hypothetical protein
MLPFLPLVDEAEQNLLVGLNRITPFLVYSDGIDQIASLYPRYIEILPARDSISTDIVISALDRRKCEMEFPE